MDKDYDIDDEKIATVLRYLELHDPKNADRDYAIQLLETMQSIAGELARSQDISPEMIKKALDQKQK